MREEIKTFDDFDTRDNDIKVKNITIIYKHIKRIKEEVKTPETLDIH